MEGLVYLNEVDGDEEEHPREDVIPENDRDVLIRPKHLTFAPK